MHTQQGKLSPLCAVPSSITHSQHTPHHWQSTNIHLTYYHESANQLAQKAQHFLAPYCGMSFLAIFALFLLYIHFGKSLWFTWIPCNEASACRVSIIKQTNKQTRSVFATILSPVDLVQMVASCGGFFHKLAPWWLF